MTMTKRKGSYAGPSERWGSDETKAVLYELEFKRKIMKPGTKFKVKRDRRTYTFHCLVYDKIRDKSWIECMCNDGQYHSILPEKIARIIIKRSYDKSVNGTRSN